ncbi:MAG TPA: GMC family oxidoreductase [Thermoanaerobaculia bacterium]
MNAQADSEYIVVGSGAGGGTLAARLAEEGRTVVLLEAGGDPRLLKGGDAVDPQGNRLPDDYDVPVFHAIASENDAMKWDFFIRHYQNDEQQRRDPKYYEELNGKRVDGVLYPRAGTLGGCTAHNAMITIYPHEADWNDLAEATGDDSWRAVNMRRYFERLENCQYRPIWRWLAKLGINPSRHGWRGWLHTEVSIPEAALKDRDLTKVIGSALIPALEERRLRERLRWLFKSFADPNDWRLTKANAVGLRVVPLTNRGRQRMGTRERVVETARKYPDRLRIELDALVTRVLFDDSGRATGVEYLKGERLYRAAAAPNPASGERHELHASREVILAGGAFNTPQLLMLSGIGPREVLERFGIPVRVDLPGVGKNLQDRYEVGVTNRMNFSAWSVLKGAKFAKGDPQYQQWAGSPRDGVYTTNGAVLAVIRRSARERPLPDLFCFALLGKFRGYFPGYSKLFPENLNYLTWAILKAHTVNRAGEVTLRSADPRDPPAIDFHYFEEGNDVEGQDLDSVVDGIKFVRRMTAELQDENLIAEEELPGKDVQSDADLRVFVRDHAWGHHASCTCAIGAREEGGVLSSDFRVHGVSGLRVVDASVFPRIPGFFIASSIYMIGEKAADVILSDASDPLG